jgi:hypothetical protein
METAGGLEGEFAVDTEDDLKLKAMLEIPSP